MTPAKMAASFVKEKRGTRYTPSESEWIKAVYTLIFKVAKKHKQFTVDHIWAEIDKARAAGKINKGGPDHRVLGPMILHMVVMGVVGSTGYYTKSTRKGGGSRPVTIWESYMVSVPAA